MTRVSGLLNENILNHKKERISYSFESFLIKCDIIFLHLITAHELKFVDCLKWLFGNALFLGQNVKKKKKSGKILL